MLQGLPGPKGQKGETVGLDKVRKTLLLHLAIEFINNFACMFRLESDLII